MKFTANETGGNFSETAYGSAFFAQYEFNLLYLQRGNKHYELTNHTSTALSTSLGNVLAVITDKRLLSCMGDTIQFSSANIVSATDYSPFGAPLPGRVFSANEYRFGFNGQEKDDEVSGDGNTMTAEFWEYDSRLGRRWNVDPEPMTDISEYAVFANNPNFFTDPFGNTLDIGKNDQSKKDVLSLVGKNNQKFLKFDDKTNSVTLDFGGLKEVEIKKILNDDEGLNLIKDMVDATQKYLYEADNLALLKDEFGAKTGVMMHLDGNGVINASNKGLDGDNKHTYQPREGYDGQVIVQSGATWQETFVSSDGSVQYKVDKLRSNLIFHELAENYERALGTNYNGYGRAIGAHDRAIIRENKWINKSLQPGVAEIKNRPVPSKTEIIEMKKRIKKYANGG